MAKVAQIDLNYRILLHWHVVLKAHKLEDNCNNDYRATLGKTARTTGH